jgi:hypothetical protein
VRGAGWGSGGPVFVFCSLWVDTWCCSLPLYNPTKLLRARLRRQDYPCHRYHDLHDHRPGLPGDVQGIPGVWAPDVVAVPLLLRACCRVLGREGVEQPAVSLANMSASVRSARRGLNQVVLGSHEDDCLNSFVNLAVNVFSMANPNPPKRNVSKARSLRNPMLFGLALPCAV